MQLINARKYEALRAVKALGMGDQYESKLVHSLEEIRTKSQRLVHEAQISNIHASHTCMFVPWAKGPMPTG